MLIVLQTSQLKSEIIWKSNEGFAIAHPSLSGAKRIKFKTKRRTNKLKKKTENNFKSLKYNYRKRRPKDSTHDFVVRRW